MERMSSRFWASRLGASKHPDRTIWKAASRESFMLELLFEKGTTGGRPLFHLYRADTTAPAPGAHGDCADRSEEHTSELQSHVNLVCRLLLEKKKKKKK